MRDGERINMEGVELAEGAINTRASSQPLNGVQAQRCTGDNHTRKEYTTQSGRTVKPPKRFNDYVRI